MRTLRQRIFGALVPSAAILAVGAGLAFAAGQFQGWPIVGGASYCSSYSTGTTGQVCNVTVPAGPTVPTGAEVIPADTGLASGQSPQTVLFSLRALNAAPVSYNLCAAAACGSFTVGNNSGGVLLAYSTTIDSATVVTPASPMDGQRFSISADHTITSLTVTANTGSSLSVTTPTVLTASTTVPQGYEFMYVASTTKWYRVR
jgi:hypothetical protein